MRVELARRAVDDLDRLVQLLSLPADTRTRVRRALRPLEELPRLGRPLEADAWTGHRVLLGPWRWMLLVHRIDEEQERIVVVTVQDARSSATVR